MVKNDVMDTSNVYSYGIDLSKFKLDLPKESKKHKAPTKHYICIDLEMTEFTASQRTCVPGVNGEIFQFGAVMLDENYNHVSVCFKRSYSSILRSENKAIEVFYRQNKQALYTIIFAS